MKRTSPEKLEAVALRAARRGAAVLTGCYEKGLRARHKGDVDLVTQADIESQRKIAETIRHAFPDHVIFAEEDDLGHDRPLQGPAWIVDPLDGTTNYAHGFPMFVISIAFREGDELRFGLVHHPLLRESFVAHKGRGARLNGRRMAVSRLADLNRSLLATGFPYDRRVAAENNLNYFCRFELAAQCVRRTGAAALDLAMVACGRLDGFWEPKLKPWDIAAGMLLVEEAGGTITDFRGEPVRDLWCGEMVASNGRIHRRMLDVIASTPERISTGKDGHSLTLTV